LIVDLLEPADPPRLNFDWNNQLIL